MMTTVGKATIVYKRLQSTEFFVKLSFLKEVYLRVKGITATARSFSALSTV